jgi:predicted dehydrogenase
MSLHEIRAARDATANAGVAFQVGFNRRFAKEFAATRDAITHGEVGTVQLMRSLTRDPGSGPADPRAVPRWMIFTQTLIHDFDTLNWLNPGTRAVDVLATADALIAPEFRAQGHLDTAVVIIRYSRSHWHRGGQLRGQLRLRRARRSLRISRHGDHGRRRDDLLAPPQHQRPYRHYLPRGH